jgi:hypothetical protein
MPRVKSASRNAHRRQRSPHAPSDSPCASDLDEPAETALAAVSPTANQGETEAIPAAMAAAFESPPDAVVLRQRRRLQLASGVSPLDGDAKRKRSPRKPRHSDSLADRLASTELSEKRVIEVRRHSRCDEYDSIF